MSDIYAEMEREKMCPRCDAICLKEERFCHECGYEFKPEIIKKGGSPAKVIIAGAFLVCFVISAFVCIVIRFMDDPENVRVTSSEVWSEPAEYIHEPETEAPTEGEPGVYVGNNTYEIGVDIPEGEYFLTVSDILGISSDVFSVARYEIKLDPESNDYVEGDWFENCKYVRLQKGYFLELSWCDAYDVNEYELPYDPFSRSGMFKVGVDVEPGEYIVYDNGYDSAGFWRIIDDLKEQRDTSLTFDGEYLGDSKVEIILEEGQYLELSHCLIRKK